MDNLDLNSLYTIEAYLRYGELPINYKEGFIGYGYKNLNGEPVYFINSYGIDDEISRQYLSIKGRFVKGKCVFMQNEDYALWLKSFWQEKLQKKYPSIQINVRKITSDELNYRRKKAWSEALENNNKILSMMET